MNKITKEQFTKCWQPYKNAQHNDEQEMNIEFQQDLTKFETTIVRAERERIILIIKGRLLIKKIRDPIIEMIRDMED